MKDYQTKYSLLISNQMTGCRIIHGSVHGITYARLDRKALHCHHVYRYGDGTNGRGLGYTMTHLSTIKVINDHRPGTVAVSSLTWHTKDPGWNYAQKSVRKYTSLMIGNNTVKQLYDVLRLSLIGTQIILAE